MIFGPKTQAAVVLLAAVIIGAAGGATVQHLRAASMEPPIQDGARRPGGRRPGPRGTPFDRLDLTDAQRDQIRAVMESYEPKTQIIMDEMIPRIRAVRDSARAEIDGFLTEEQRARLEEMDSFWDRRRGPGRPGRPGRFPGGPPPFPDDSNRIRR
jgi:hypothetical protein